jgi:hypothetical protein
MQRVARTITTDVDVRNRSCGDWDEALLFAIYALFACDSLNEGSFVIALDQIGFGTRVLEAREFYLRYQPSTESGISS